MSGEGPTTAGSIVGKLQLDTSDWDAKLAAADAAARKLGSDSPTIRVDADTSAADTKMSASESIARKLGATSPNVRVTADTSTVAAKLAAVEAAERKAAISAEALRLAYQRLDDIQSRDEGPSLRLSAAHLAASRAEDTDKTATDRLAAAKVALAAAQDAAAAATGNEAAATNKANSSNGVTISRMALIAGLIVTLIPMLAPLTGAVLGLAGAFTMLGAAGVLGVMGVVSAMKQGTAVGDEYSAGLKTLKGDLDQLSSTAASTLLRSFNDSVGLINSAMPDLNMQVGYFASQLGVIGSSLLQGVVTALRVLNPLFVQAGSYVQKLAAGFNAWTSNGGLKKFGDYAQATFPQVTAALGSLVQAAISLVSALAPLGTVMLNLITVAAGLIQWFTSFGPVLSIVAGGALAAFGAFKLWALIGPILAAVAAKVYTATDSVVALGIAIDATSGPIGWVVAGIGALVAVLGISAAASQSNTQATDAYTSALQQSNGALDENIRKQVAKNLSDAGLLTTAKQYHLQLSTVTDAVLGNKAAMDQVEAATNKYGKTLVQVHGQDGAVVSSYETLSDKARDFIKDVNGQNSSLKDGVQAFKDQKAAADSSTYSMSELTQAQKTLDQAQTTVTTDTEKFATALEALGKVNLTADQANIKYQQSLSDESAAVQKNGATLDESTQKGRDNASALDNIASSAVALIAAEARQGASETDLQTAMGNSRTSFINAAEAAGATAQQAADLADKYGLIPSNVSTAYTTTGLADAINQVSTLQNAISVLLSDEKAVNLGGSVAGYYGFGGHAAGGEIGNGLAGGGFSGAVVGLGNAFNDRAGLYPLSDGEWVTSNQFGQAQKYMSTLQAINSGSSRATVAATLGVRAPTTPVVHNHYSNTFTVVANDPNELMQKVSIRQNRMGVV